MCHHFGSRPRNWLCFLIIFAVITGITFRFINLDRKVYWFDEGVTTYRISNLGKYLESFEGQIITVEELIEYPGLTPRSNANQVVEELFLVPQHTPLYFTALWLWSQKFGLSTAATRGFSAIISLLVFPCLYWLCIELFQSSLVAWVAIALVAVSPFHILYSQEARMYSLLTVLILLSSASLLHAIRVRTRSSWLLYSVTLAVGLWTQPIFSLTAISHSFYIALTEGFRLSKVVVAYIGAVILALLMFLPWIIILLIRSDQLSTLDWVDQEISQLTLIQYWGINISRLFLDILPTYRLDTDFSEFNNPLLILLIAAILVVVLYAFYFLYRHASAKAYLFIFILFSTTILALILPDLIRGGIRSNNPRYLIASYLGIQLAVSYLFASKISDLPAKAWQSNIWRGGFVALIVCGILSATVSSQAQTWWNKYYSSDLVSIASIVNQANNPLLIIDLQKDDITLWSVKDFLKPKVNLLLLDNSHFSNIPKEFSNVFLFHPAEELQNRFPKEHSFKAAPIYPGEMSLWKLKSQ